MSTTKDQPGEADESPIEFPTSFRLIAVYNYASRCIKAD